MSNHLKGTHSGGHGMHVVRVVRIYPGPRSRTVKKLNKVLSVQRRLAREAFANDVTKTLILDDDKPL